MSDEKEQEGSLAENGTSEQQEKVFETQELKLSSASSAA